MRLPLTIAILSISPLITACATPAAKVQALEVSSSQYDGFNCRQLRESEKNWMNNAEALSKQQTDARAGDTVGVILLGIPASSLSGGDVETQLAQAKGHVKTIQEVIVRKSC